MVVVLSWINDPILPASPTRPIAFVAIFSLLRHRLGRYYRRNVGPHVALAQTQVRERTPFDEQNR